MPRPSTHPRGRLLGLVALALAWLPTSTSLGQGIPGDSSLARYVPRDGVQLYLEYEGLDAHADAWRKTAAYKILNNTPTGAMLEDLAVQLLDRLVALSPGTGTPSKGADGVAMIKHVAHNGFLVAFVINPADPNKNHGIMVIRNAFKDKAIRPIIAKELQGMNAPNTKPQRVARAGHTIVGGVRKNGQGFAWWVEESKKEDIVQVFPGAEAADVFLEALDGKRPSLAGDPRRAELAKSEAGFQPNGWMFIEPALFQSPKIPSYLGLSDVKKLDLRWGFQDDALMSTLRIAAPSPRKGLLALLDGPSFEPGKLPPIPESAGNFTVLSLDLKATVDRVSELAKAISPTAGEQITKALETVKAKTKLRLKEDILPHLGPKAAWYVMPAKAASTPAALGSGLIGKFMASAQMDVVPKLAIVLDIDDPVAFGKVLDEVMAATNRELKAQAATPPAGGGDAPQPKSGRNRGPSGPVFQFQMSTGDTKAYVLSVPSDLASQVPASFRPAIRVGPKHVAIAVSPDVAKQALEAKSTWNPPGELSGALQALPSKLTMLSLVDPRDTLPGVLAALPQKLQAGINTAILLQKGMAAPAGAAPGGPPNGPGPGSGPGSGGRGPDSARRSSTTPPIGGSGGSGGPTQQPGMMNRPGTPGGAGAGMFTLQVDAAKLPTADAIKALLFPSIYTIEVNDQEIRITSRVAFPALGDPSATGTASSLMPMIKEKLGLAPPAAPATTPASPSTPGQPANPGSLKPN